MASRWSQRAAGRAVPPLPVCATFSGACGASVTDTKSGAIDLTADPAWRVLGDHCRRLATIDLARLTLDLDTYLVKVTALVDTIFSPA
jgi:hypothetical protein